MTQRARDEIASRQRHLHTHTHTHTHLEPCTDSALPPQVSQATGYFELQLISVENPGGRRLSGDCCGAERRASEGRCGADACNTYFKVCLKEYQTEVVARGPCTYGSDTTKVLGGNTFQFKSGQKSGASRNNEAGKVLIPFQFAWPVSGSVTLLSASRNGWNSPARRRVGAGGISRAERKFGAVVFHSAVW